MLQSFGKARAIAISGVSKRFGAQSILRGIDLDIEPGELLALLGPSGSGKTTLLRLIAGLDQPSEGAILFDGEDASHLTVQRRRVGFIFQSYALFKHMSVFDNIAYGLTVRPRQLRPSREAIRAGRGIARHDAAQRLRRPLSLQLSGGQRQRVAFARALAVEPQVLLLDEPFGALDAKVRKDLREGLREIHDRTGLTTVFVTHDQAEAMDLADRVAILNGGRIEQIGRPEDVRNAQATPFVADFLE